MIAAAIVLVTIAVDVGRPSRAGGAPAPPPADVAIVYRPPVDAPVLDPFREPLSRYGPGNRGIDYAVVPGTPVRAMADGEVVFAGPVAGTLHVTVRHADGLRSSYSFLASVSVHAGQRVRLGDVVGRTSEVLHVGVRTPDDTYLDPASLFAAPRHARLVPGGDDGTSAAGATAGDRRDLAATVAERAGPLGALLARGAVVVPDLVARARLWQDLLAEADWTIHARRITTGLVAWTLDRDHCTPADQPAPAPGSGRILVEVGGIGSTSEAASIADVDEAALGYAPGDVVRFSYGGGRVPSSGADPGWVGAVPVTTYDAAASQAPLVDSAARLADLLRAVAAARPGTPIDVVAHSQGGVVARLALTEAGADGSLPPAVGHLVTLGAPHRGADPAGAVRLGRSSAPGRALEDGTTDLLGLELDPGAPAVRDLAPGSAVVDSLEAGSVPASVHVTSIAARGDLVVPAPRSAVDGVRPVTVALTGASAHDRLPGAPETARELGLALADRAPTCEGLTDVVGDLVVGEQVARVEAGGALLAGLASAAAGPP